MDPYSSDDIKREKRKRNPDNYYSIDQLCPDCVKRNRKTEDSNECFVIVSDDQRRIYIWTSPKSSVRQKFILAKQSQEIRMQFGPDYAITVVDEGNVDEMLSDLYSKSSNERVFTTKSAPKFSGFCSAGDANVLSTIHIRKVGYGLSMIAFVIASLPMLFIDSYIPALITSCIMGFGFGGMLYFIWYIVADCIDDDELKTGVRREGSFFGIANFFMRLSMVLSITTISLVFTETDWEEYIPNPGVVVETGLRFLFVIVPAIALGLSLVCLYFYPFSKKKVLEMKEKLAELHKGKLEKVRSS